jgi:hypothetical protein
MNYNNIAASVFHHFPTQLSRAFMVIILPRWYKNYFSTAQLRKRKPGLKQLKATNRDVLQKK